jgi:ketosteroid isomerase-like protein
MKKSGVVVVILLVWFAVSLGASAQEHHQGQRIVTRTRLQVLFSDLEDQWLKAIQQKDAPSLDRLLSEDFQVWTPTPPGSPMPREDWQTAAFGRKLRSFEYHQLAVRSASPEIAIASFVLTETFDQAGKSVSEDHFVVDVWAKNGEGDNWRCTDRYWWKVSGASHPAGSKPGVKPSGKE